MYLIWWMDTTAKGAKKNTSQNVYSSQHSNSSYYWGTMSQLEQSNKPRGLVCMKLTHNLKLLREESHCVTFHYSKRLILSASPSQGRFETCLIFVTSSSAVIIWLFWAIFPLRKEFPCVVFGLDAPFDV